MGKKLQGGGVKLTPPAARIGLRSVNISNLYFSTLPEYVVVETTEHKCLQSQFSVLYNEAMQLKTQLEENRFFFFLLAIFILF